MNECLTTPQHEKHFAIGKSVVIGVTRTTSVIALDSEHYRVRVHQMLLSPYVGYLIVAV